MTRNEALVYDLLCKADRPLSAYNILDGLRNEGFKAPLQVYRALTKLIDRGAVHRIESVNGFVACQLHDCADNAVSIFMLCADCEAAIEFTDPSIDAKLQQLGKDKGFTLAHKVIEVTGTCPDCANRLDIQQ
jgi:Fur family zinc uptake transcriptional regulator